MNEERIKEMLEPILAQILEIRKSEKIDAAKVPDLIRDELIKYATEADINLLQEYKYKADKTYFTK